MKNHKAVDYILTYILICVPGTLFFNSRQIVFYAAFIFAFLIFIIRKKTITKDFFRFILIVLLLLLLQTIKFKEFSIISFIGLLMALFYPYFIARAVGPNIIPLFVKIIKFISIVSLIFYIPSIISVDFYEYISRIPTILNSDTILPNQNFLIYTVEPAKTNIFNSDIYRNAGNFTEPGVFSVWLIFALIFNLLIDKQIFNITNGILIFTILTTFSTAGYITLIFLVFSFLLSTKKLHIQIIFIPLLFFAGTFIFESVDFLKVKIDEQVNYQINAGNTEEKRGRFASLYKDLNEFQHHYITGRGLIKQTRFDNLKEEDIAMLNKDINDPKYSSLNGTSDLLVRLGLIGFIYYTILLYNCFSKICIINNKQIILALYSLLTIYLVMMSQRLTFNAPLIMLLFIFPLKRFGTGIYLNNTLKANGKL